MKKKKDLRNPNSVNARTNGELILHAHGNSDKTGLSGSSPTKRKSMTLLMCFNRERNSEENIFDQVFIMY